MVENEQFPMIAKTLAELEDVLAEELIGLGADNVVIGTAWCHLQVIMP